MHWYLVSALIISVVAAAYAIRGMIRNYRYDKIRTRQLELLEELNECDRKMAEYVKAKDAKSQYDLQKRIEDIKILSKYYEDKLPENDRIVGIADVVKGRWTYKIAQEQLLLWRYWCYYVEQGRGKNVALVLARKAVDRGLDPKRHGRS